MIANIEQSMVPETARFNLEELDAVSSKSYKEISKNGLDEIYWCFMLLRENL